ncbi:hypothetical protein Q7P37_006021 [Cladosporium fusiforme]
MAATAADVAAAAAFAAALSAVPVAPTGTGATITAWLYNSYVEETLDTSFEVVNNGRFDALECFTRPVSRDDFDYLYLSRRQVGNEQQADAGRDSVATIFDHTSGISEIDIGGALMDDIGVYSRMWAAEEANHHMVSSAAVEGAEESSSGDDTLGEETEMTSPASSPSDKCSK